MTALIIRGGTAVNHDHSRRADVLVDGETIVAVGSPLDVAAGVQVIDAGGCYVMPGGIDPHTHLELAFMGSVSAERCGTLSTRSQPDCRRSAWRSSQ